MKRTAHGERGQALLLVLATMFVGTFLVSSSLSLVSTSVTSSDSPVANFTSYSSAEAGAQHGLWRLQNEAGFADSITQASPSANYNLTLNGATVPVTITEIFPTPTPTPTPGPTPDPALRIVIAKSVSPNAVMADIPATFTYAIEVTNVGTSNVKLKSLDDTLPAGFSYVPGSSSGFTTADPIITMVGGREELLWDFGTPRPGIGGGSAATQVFQATANPSLGVYYNDAVADAVPPKIGDPILEVYTGPTAPMDAFAERYEIISQVEGVTIRVTVDRTGAGVSVVAWVED